MENENRTDLDGDTDSLTPAETPTLTHGIFAAASAMAGAIGPERRMWRAVLDRIVLDALGLTDLRSGRGDPHGQAVRQARHWFRRNNKDLEAVCAFAGVDAAWLRAGMVRAIERLEATESNTIGPMAKRPAADVINSLVEEPADAAP